MFLLYFLSLFTFLAETLLISLINTIFQYTISFFPKYISLSNYPEPSPHGTTEIRHPKSDETPVKEASIC